VVLRRDRVRGGDLLLMPERVVELNGTAAAILRLCDPVCRWSPDHHLVEAALAESERAEAAPADDHAGRDGTRLVYRRHEQRPERGG